jgi:hypothetical protein
VLLGLQRRAFIVPGLGLGFHFFLRTGGEIFQRDRRFLVAIRSSTSSAAARLTVSSHRLAHAVSEMYSNSTGGTFMKYLLMMIIALATISTVTATSQRADCCAGAKCCSSGHCCAR